MGVQVSMGAVLQCSFGVAPSALMVLPVERPMAPLPTANISDSVPLLNILPFGMCSSIANPEVIAATAAALGVLTPMPCVPAVPAPWIPAGAGVMIGGMPAIDNNAKAMCMWGGVIQITFPGQVQVVDG